MGDFGYIFGLCMFFSFFVGVIVGWLSSIKLEKQREHKLIIFMQNCILSGTDPSVDVDEWKEAFETYMKGETYDD